MRGVFPNPDGKILPGLYARIYVPIREKVALLVPQEAVGYDQRGTYVLTVNDQGVVDRRGVKTGILAQNLRVIEEGLTGKEWVVINAVQKAIPGRTVTPQRQNAEKKATP
jgi:multidrug efflux pump subunit AcrA (membrane-fusion protein)